jgi:two-component system cell cycle sensor histidine kinase/response regulator CckA
MSVPPPPEHHLTLNRLATIARLVAGAAHEVNNALQVIGGSAELLQNRTDLPEPVQKTLTRIRDQAARAASAMTGVVALSRPQPDGSYQIDLRDVASRAVELRQFSIGRAELAVQLHVPPTPQLVQGQRLHLLQAALNLIQNAEQALTPRRSGVIRVEVADDGDHVLLRVSDDGPGVPPADAERIFQPFVTSQPRPESTGLGLPVAREIAVAHRGSLELEPGPVGAAFRLRLPKAPGASGLSRNL